MKNKYLLLTIFSLFLSAASFASSSDTLKVLGNCSECKGHIEKAAKAGGAMVADWNQKTKILIVSYDAAITSRLKIEQTVAASGYDTPDIKATNDSYNKLEECCQYPRQSTSN